MSDPQIIAGAVNSDGTVDSGRGFSVSKVAGRSGAYTIFFPTPFNSLPSVVVTVRDTYDKNHTRRNGYVYNVANDQFTVSVGGNDGEDSSKDFNFIAIAA